MTLIGYFKLVLTLSGACLTPLVLTPWQLRGPLGGLRSLV